MHAAMIGRHYIERFARIPAEVDNAAEFRYRGPVLDDRTLVRRGGLGPLSRLGARGAGSRIH